MNNYARTGGILSIISGAFSILSFVFMAAMFSLAMFFIQKAPSTSGSDNLPPEMFFSMLGVMGTVGFFVFIIPGVLAIIGGAYSLKKKRWALALAGAIGAAIILFPCGIAATVLISRAKHEFMSSSDETSSMEVEHNTASPGGSPHRATIAGILAIVAAVMGIVSALAQCFFYVWPGTLYKSIFSQIYGDMANIIEHMRIFLITWEAFILVLGVLAIVGGVFAIKKKNWGLALAGAIAGTIAFWPCGIVAIILLVYSQNEFKVAAPAQTELTA